MKKGKKLWTPNRIFLLIGSICFCQLAGLFGALFISTSLTTWYPNLIKPWFNPPGWVFGPIWILLFALMGISLFIILDTAIDKGILKTRRTEVALGFFVAQLILNAFWTMAFFRFQSPVAAFIDIFFMWIAILITIVLFYRISKPAAYSMIPYIVWVSFAALLNVYIILLN